MEKVMNDTLKPAALSVLNAATYTGLSRSTLYRLMESGELDSFKLGARRLIRLADLDRLLDDAETNTILDRHR